MWLEKPEMIDGSHRRKEEQVLLNGQLLSFLILTENAFNFGDFCIGNAMVFNILAASCHPLLFNVCGSTLCKPTA